ncbi:hypothetical protein HOY80DRAFT_1062467 [Tuber brumale]|nr:hypothetical protein HOY80DRAFT_1062467 [Tuber brumale]
MAYPNHSLWLTIVRDTNQICLLEYDRLQALAATSVTNTQPVLISLIGRDSQYRALKPILLADCGLLSLDLTPEASLDSDLQCIPHARRPLLWLGGDGDGYRPYDRVRQLLCGQLLGPFTHVLCIFASDVGGLWGVVRFISHWGSLLGVGLWFPEIVVIRGPATNTPRTPAIDTVETQLLSDMMRTMGASCPLGIEVVEVSDAHIMGHILASCHRARERRRHSQTLYSFSHMIALFGQACDHAAETLDDPFNPIIASRYLNPVPPTISLCLEAFLNILGPQRFHRASRLIASSIAFNAMPPRMHAFPPLCIFDTLYRAPCETAIQRARVNSPIASLASIRSLVQDEICAVHDYSMGSAEYYRKTLKRQWEPIDKPISSQVFGERCNDQAYTFHILECVICSARFDGVRVHIKPPTAGARILAVDGGGVRGVVALTSLVRLEAAVSRIIGVELPIQDLFDLAIGTSSAEECLRQFIRLANRAFRRPHLTCLPILPRIIDYILSFVADSQYSAETIEEALQEAFGSERDIFTSDNNRTKVAGTMYFSPKLLVGLGTFQDGGLCQNNPTSSALSESKYIWPGAPEPDNVVSVGTGSALYTPHLTEQFTVGPPQSSRGSGLTRRNGFLLRAYRSYMYLLDGEPTWQRLLGGLPLRRKNRFYRLNIQIQGREPSIDDTAEMPGLCLRSPPIHALNATAWAMIANLFYFELAGMPFYERGSYTCKGRIQCRLGERLRRLILEGLARQQTQFIRCGEVLSSDHGGSVRFTVIDLQVEVAIDLHARY